MSTYTLSLGNAPYFTQFVWTGTQADLLNHLAAQAVLVPGSLQTTVGDVSGLLTTWANYGNYPASIRNFYSAQVDFPGLRITLYWSLPNLPTFAPDVRYWNVNPGPDILCKGLLTILQVA